MRSSRSGLNRRELEGELNKVEISMKNNREFEIKKRQVEQKY